MWGAALTGRHWAQLWDYTKAEVLWESVHDRGVISCMCAAPPAPPARRGACSEQTIRFLTTAALPCKMQNSVALPQSRSHVNNRCLDPSGTRLVCGCEDHTIVTVDLPDFDALRTARAALAAPPDESDEDAAGGDGGEGGEGVPPPPPPPPPSY